MLSITLASLRAHLGRLLLSSAAIVLATAFVAGTFVFTDAMRSSLLGAFSQDLGRAGAVVTAPGDRDMPGDVLSAVRRVPGVVHAERRAVWDAALRSGDRFEPATIVSIAPGSTVGWPKVVQGRLASRPGETVLGHDAAQRGGVGIGDTVGVPLHWEGVVDRERETRKLRVVGLVDPGSAPRYSSGAFLGVTDEQLRELTDEVKVASVLAVAAGELPPAELAARIDRVVGRPYVVRTAEEQAQQEVSSGGLTAGVTAGLLAFAGIALFVAGIVIANTFSILLVQRTREMALLRCVGVTRGQVFRSMLAESAALGLAASVVGVLTGFGLAYGVGAALSATFEGFPFGAVALSATAVVVPVAVGLAVTIGAALLPARAATRIPPVAALRDQGIPTRRGGRTRSVLAMAALLTGVAGMAVGTLVRTDTAGFIAAFAGGVLTFLGILLAGPALIPPLVRLVGATLGRWLGAPGRLAAVNAVRNPRRATATASALLVGVTLMTIMSVGAASLQATVTAQMDEEFPVDFMVRSGEGNIPPALVEDIRGIPGLSDIAIVRGTTTSLNGQKIAISGVDPHQLAAVTSQLPSICGLRPGQAVITQPLARTLRITPGDTLHLPPATHTGHQDGTGSGKGDQDSSDPATATAPSTGNQHGPGNATGNQHGPGNATGNQDGTGNGEGDRETTGIGNGIGDGGGQARGLTITSIFPTKGSAAVVYLTHQDLDRLYPDATIGGVYAQAEPDADLLAIGAAIDRATTGSSVTVTGTAKTQATYSELLDTLLLVVTALLAVAVLIAVVGIANTLALSVHERTRESALLRALGLTRGQLRATLAVEAALLAAVGSLLGAGLGTLFGWVGLTSMLGPSFGIVLDVSALHLAGLIAVAVLAGLLASVLPARRAARASVVSALASE
ncbi:ABC transporter permease [Nonomuraea candida]|uniref:ABC transporter permease n=1 Tax=Nonomuraea candida TaxID=359159 RepID=UPI000693757E|nr:FtsX-like permease family protein [Nonomuraea candida]